MSQARRRSGVTIAPGDLATWSLGDDAMLYTIIAVPRAAERDPYDAGTSAVAVNPADRTGAYVTHTLAHRGCNVIVYQV